jgi:uncharacterized protein (TIGR02266 family)
MYVAARLLSIEIAWSPLNVPPRLAVSHVEVTNVDSKDRRQHPRLSIDVEVDFTSGNNFYSARIRDISMGGLFIEAATPIAVGTQLVVDLRFLKKHLRVDCEVMWALTDAKGCSGVGVRFLDLKPAAKKSIEAFMVLRRPLPCGEVTEGPPPLPAQVTG